MEQMYKEIAGIIKSELDFKERLSKKDTLLTIVDKLSSYFEREDKKKQEKYWKRWGKYFGAGIKGFHFWWRFHHFNPKDFKKRCGVR